jgi:hypothetical protein
MRLASFLFLLGRLVESGAFIGTGAKHLRGYQRRLRG